MEMKRTFYNDMKSRGTWRRFREALERFLNRIYSRERFANSIFASFFSVIKLLRFWIPLVTQNKNGFDEKTRPKWSIGEV